METGVSTRHDVCNTSSMYDVLGWLSSLVLLATIGTQIIKQWRARSSQGVSRWLFIGQSLASAGFTLYSALIENWVFTVTNGLLLMSAIVGWCITAHFRKHEQRGRAQSR